MSVWPTHMYMYHIHAWCLWKPEVGIKSPELESQIVIATYVGAGN